MDLHVADYLDVIGHFSSNREELTPSCEWYNQEWRDQNQVVKYFWSRVISVAMVASDLRHCARYDTYITLCISDDDAWCQWQWQYRKMHSSHELTSFFLHVWMLQAFSFARASKPRFLGGGRQQQVGMQTCFGHFSRKLHDIGKKIGPSLGHYCPLALDPLIKTSVADLSICMWSLTLINRLRWAVYLDVLNKQCGWWCNVNWTVFIQGQRCYVVYVPLIHRDTHTDYARLPDTHLRIRLQIQSTNSKEMIG